MRNFLWFAAFSILIASCSTKKVPEQVAARDTTITVENSFTELFTDSVKLADFQKAHPVSDSISNKIQSFYNQRNYQFAWFFPDGMADFVSSFLSLQDDYIHYSGDSTLYSKKLIADVDSLKKLTRINPNDALVLNTELELTQHFFLYTEKAYEGDQRINIKELNWFIPRKKVNPVAFLDSLLKNKGNNLAQYEPVNRQYNLLKKHLQRFDSLRTVEWNEIPFSKKFKKGDSSPTIPDIKNRLAQLGDMAVVDTTDIFDEDMKDAVKIFQQRYGLTADGVIGAGFLREINVPVQQRIRQILINMERIRWVPATPSTDYLLVNIPEFMLHVYEAGKHSFDMNVVVGSEAHSTVIFSGRLNQVVFSPYWNIPPSILKNEVLPGIRKNPNYLARHNMEWNGNSVRQKPGKSNSLGLVKFLFPNGYNIYLHDTPSKSLFGETNRAFSHGCIRLSQPAKLAEFLLRKDSTWTEEKIQAAMHAGKEKYVRLRGANEIPVFIGYFTAWVDQNGLLNFRKDVYGHDQKMAERLFGQPETISLK